MTHCQEYTTVTIHPRTNGKTDDDDEEGKQKNVCIKKGREEFPLQISLPFMDFEISKLKINLFCDSFEFYENSKISGKSVENFARMWTYFIEFP